MTRRLLGDDGLAGIGVGQAVALLNDAILTFPHAAKKKSSADSAELLLTQ